MISVKYTAEQAVKASGDTSRDLSNPTFIWMNSVNKQAIKYQIINNADDLSYKVDLIEISENLLKDQFEKTGKSHPLYKFENIEEITKKCETVLCEYDVIHSIFEKMPDSKKEYMYDLISYSPGDFNSIGFKWLSSKKSF